MLNILAWQFCRCGRVLIRPAGAMLCSGCWQDADGCPGDGRDCWILSEQERREGVEEIASAMRRLDR